MTVIQQRTVDQDVPTDKTTFMQVNQKSDKGIPPAFEVLAFFTVVGIFIYNPIYAESMNFETRNSAMVVDLLTENFESKCIAHSTKCRVNCSGIDDDGEGLLAGYINDAVRNNRNCNDEIEDLKLYSCNFQKGTLKERWLEEVKYDVMELTIYGGNLKEIDENALSSYPFEWLQQLILAELNMRTLKKKYFLGMTPLDSFEFRWNEIRPLYIEENALEGMKSVTRISYMNVHLDDDGLSNSFGCTGAKLNKLELLSLMHGRIEKLTECSFTSIPGIKSIYLQDVNLESIDKNAFQNNPLIHLLHLDQNNLTTLKNGTFDPLGKTSGNVDVHLGENSWHCNCSLQWLKDDLLQKIYINTTFPPLCNNKENFADVNFCVAA